MGGQGWRTGSHMMGINGRSFAMDRIDVTAKLGTSEIWEIVAAAMPMAHPFHVHGASFRILSKGGRKPSAHESGWKDVVLVEEHAELLVRFDNPAPAEDALHVPLPHPRARGSRHDGTVRRRLIESAAIMSDQSRKSCRTTHLELCHACQSSLVYAACPPRHRDRCRPCRQRGGLCPGQVSHRSCPAHSRRRSGHSDACRGRTPLAPSRKSFIYWRPIPKPTGARSIWRRCASTSST